MATEECHNHPRQMTRTLRQTPSIHLGFLVEGLQMMMILTKEDQERQEEEEEEEIQPREIKAPTSS